MQSDQSADQRYGDGLAEDEAGGELLDLGAKGLAGFGAVDAFQADLGFPAVPEDLNSVAVPRCRRTCRRTSGRKEKLVLGNRRRAAESRLTAAY